MYYFLESVCYDLIEMTKNVAKVMVPGVNVKNFEEQKNIPFEIDSDV